MVFKELKCRSCGNIFEQVIREGEQVSCPACGSKDVGTNFSGGTCNCVKKGCSGNCKTCGGCH